MSSNWICCQIGAREHYAVARALHQQGKLAGLVTDWYAFGKQKSEILKTENLKSESGKQNILQCFSVSAFQQFGNRGHAALAARAEGIPDELVHAFPFRSLFWKWRVRRLEAQGRSFEAFAQTDAAFAAAVAQLRLPSHDVFFGYSYASLETLAVEKKRGVLTVLDQIDPGAVEFRVVAEEMARFPELAGPPLEFPAAYYERNRREWALADRIVVNSEFCREALIKQGVPSEKLAVIPLAFETNAEKQKAESRNLSPSTFNHQPSTTPLRVLFLGQVNVRKGIHYLMEAAKLLANEPVQFDVVGPMIILPAAVASAPRNMKFHGPVSRDGAAEWYRQADFFVLPTLSDGFAITQLEAMACGLPVVTTPCCGNVVTDGVDGFIVPARDADALAGALHRYLAEPDLLRSHQTAAFAKSKQFTLNRLRTNLLNLETSLFSS